MGYCYILELISECELSNGEPAKTGGSPKLLLLPSLWETPCPSATAVRGLSSGLQRGQEPSFPHSPLLSTAVKWCKPAFPLASQDGQEGARLPQAQEFGKMWYFPSCRHRGHCRSAEGYLFPCLGSAYFPPMLKLNKLCLTDLFLLAVKSRCVCAMECRPRRTSLCCALCIPSDRTLWGLRCFLLNNCCKTWRETGFAQTASKHLAGSTGWGNNKP